MTENPLDYIEKYKVGPFGSFVPKEGMMVYVNDVEELLKDYIPKSEIDEAIETACDRCEPYSRQRCLAEKQCDTIIETPKAEGFEMTIYTSANKLPQLTSPHVFNWGCKNDGCYQRPCFAQKDKAPRWCGPKSKWRVLK